MVCSRSVFPSPPNANGGCDVRMQLSVPKNNGERWYSETSTWSCCYQHCLRCQVEHQRSCATWEHSNSKGARLQQSRWFAETDGRGTVQVGFSWPPGVRWLVSWLGQPSVQWRWMWDDQRSVMRSTVMRSAPEKCCKTPWHTVGEEDKRMIWLSQILPRDCFGKVCFCCSTFIPSPKLCFQPAQSYSCLLRTYAPLYSIGLPLRKVCRRLQPKLCSVNSGSLLDASVQKPTLLFPKLPYRSSASNTWKYLRFN